jgi:hypothetical protein
MFRMSVTIDPFEILDKAHNDFATAPIEEAFNWDKFAKYTVLDYWYMVAFRSIRKLDANLAELEMLDELAHQDAATQPGFLFYFKGKIMGGASHLHNMSFCMWTDRASARAAAKRTMHRQASNVALKMYDKYSLERYEARVTRSGKQPRIEFTAL